MDKEVKRDNMIPGSCEEFTRPEEIKALSKYLRKVKKDLEDNTYLIRDNLELYGRADGRTMRHIDELPDKVESLQKGDHPEVSTLPGHKEVLDAKDTIEELPGDKISLDDVSQETSLSDHIETIEVTDKPFLEKRLEILENAIREAELENEKVLLEDNTETKLDNYKSRLQDTEQDIELSSTREDLGNTDKPIDLPKKKEILEDSNSNLDKLGDYVETLHPSVEPPHLEDHREDLIVKDEASLSDVSEALPKDVVLQEHEQFDPNRDTLYDANIARPGGDNDGDSTLEDYVDPLLGKREDPKLHDESTITKIQPKPEEVKLHDDSTITRVKPSPEEVELHDDSTITRIEPSPEEVELHDESTVTKIKPSPEEPEIHDDSTITPILGKIPEPELSDKSEQIVGKIPTPRLNDDSTITKIQPGPTYPELHDDSTVTRIQPRPEEVELHDESTITKIQPSPEEVELHDESTITKIQPKPEEVGLHDESTVVQIEPSPEEVELHDESTRTSIDDAASGEHAQFNPDGDSLYDANIILPGNIVDPELHDDSTVTKIQPSPEEVELHDESTVTKIEPSPEEVELHDESTIVQIEPGPEEVELHDDSTITRIEPSPEEVELHDDSTVTKIEPSPEEVELHDNSTITKIEPSPEEVELHDDSTITKIEPKPEEVELHDESTVTKIEPSPVDPELHDNSTITKIEPGPEEVELHDESTITKIGPNPDPELHDDSTVTKIQPEPEEVELTGSSSISHLDIPKELSTEVQVKFDPNINKHTARTSGIPSENPIGWGETLDDIVEDIVGDIPENSLSEKKVELEDTSPEDSIEKHKELLIDTSPEDSIEKHKELLVDTSPEDKLVSKKIIEENNIEADEEKFVPYLEAKRKKKLEGWVKEKRRQVDLETKVVPGIPAPTNSLADGPVEDLIRDISMLRDKDLNVYYQNILKFANDNVKNLGKWGEKARSIMSSLASSKMTSEDLENFEKRLYGSIILEDYATRKEDRTDEADNTGLDAKLKKTFEDDNLFFEGIPLSNLPKNYFNSVHGIGSNASNPSTYLRWLAERSVGSALRHDKSGKLSSTKSSLRQIALDETLALLVLARDKMEKLTKSNRDRLPGNEGLLGDVGKLISQGATAAVTSLAKKAVKGMFGANKLDYTVPQNRPTKKQETSSFIAMNDKGRDYSSKSGIEGKEYNFNKEYLSGPVIHGIKVSRSVNEVTGGAADYSPGENATVVDTTSKVSPRAGMMTTLSELCGKENASEVDTVDKLFNLLKNSPYISTAGKVTSSNEHPLKVSTLDSNMRWEIIFTPFVGIENGEMSFLPPIEEINVWNSIYHGIKTGYNYFAPINSFELGKAKLNSKTVPLFEGEISYPTSMEFTNELRLTFVDDQFKSWRTYFERCVDASVYNSTAHKKEDYNGTYDLQGKLTAIDKTYTCIAPYKNIAFRCTIYSMTPQYSTVSKYDLLLVMKDFAEERSGDIDASGQDLTVNFSIVGENPRNELTKVTISDATKSKVYAPPRNNNRGGYESIINGGIDNMVKLL